MNSPLNEATSHFDYSPKGGWIRGSSLYIHLSYTFAVDKFGCNIGASGRSEADVSSSECYPGEPAERDSGFCSIKKKKDSTVQNGELLASSPSYIAS